MNTILYIEDDADDVQILNRLITRADPNNRNEIDIIHAGSLADGINILNEHEVNAILLDLSLPDGFGISTFEKMYKQYPDIPIVVLSSLDDEHFAMKAVKMGAQDYLVKGQLTGYLFFRSIHYAIERHKLLMELCEARKHEQYLAYYDTVTKLPNRQHFFSNFQNQLNLAKRNKSQVAILFLDLDDFKKVNDNYGHHYGDLFLLEIAERCKKLLRKSDLIARFGGDEFVIALYNISQLSDVENVAHKMLASFSEPVVIESNKLAISASIGISIYPTDGSDIDQLINNADKAMYVAKSEGKNSIKHYNESMQ